MRPPANRAMKSLNRAFFRKRFPISAARIFDNKNISSVRQQLVKSKDTLGLERLSLVQADPELEVARKGRKCVLLRPALKHDDPSTWSSLVQELVDSQRISLVPYDLELDYGYWTYHDIISSVLPESELDEIPSGFNVAGHVAHLNLRDHSLPYKHLIAEVIIDKNPQITTVINKVRDVGEDDEFRTFAYEVLAGPDNLNVEVKEENCTYRFDYSKVYWNSKLHTEHRRLLDMFKEGEAVCDVMAGIGPFALPAGKKHVFVWANDLNPHSYKYLTEGIQRNKVGNLVKPFNEDGRQFIRSAAADLYKQNGTHKAILPSPKLNKSQSKDEAGSTSTAEALTKTELQQPRTFAHYIMNLPASAVTFLPSFIGLYSSLLNESLNPPTRHSDLPLPMIHCHTFGVKPERPEDVIPEEIKICEEISKQLGAGIKRTDPEVTIHNVRDVAPRKTMFCASFRLPEEVAWRKP